MAALRLGGRFFVHGDGSLSGGRFFAWVTVHRLGDEASSVFTMRNSKISLAGIGGVAQQDRASGPERKRSPGKPDEKGLLAIFTYKKPPALTANI